VLGCDWSHSVWTKSLVCKDAVLQGIPLFRSVSEDSTVRKVGSLSAVRMMCHPVRTLICPLLQPSGRRVIPSGHQTDQVSSIQTTWTSVRTLHCIEKLLFQLASVRTSEQPVRTPINIRPSFRFFQSSFMGRLMQPSGRRGFPS
jgi:hypothetical protein